MTGSLDPVENQTPPETSRQPEGVADRLLRRKSASGVALPQIQRRLARITRASTRIRENRLVLPGSARRERILNFNTALRQKQAKAPRVTSRMAKNRQQVPWEQLDMSLPNGAPAENPRPDVLRASLGDVGFPSGGQVIAPFSPPDSSNEPSFLERRRARIGAQEEKKKPAPSWKKPDPASRLFSRVEEIKPSGGTPAAGGAEKPPAQDHGAPKSSPSDAIQAASKKPEPTDKQASKGPASTPGKPSTVQREMARGAVPMPPSMDNESRPEPEPAVNDREPETPLEEIHSDLKTLAPRKQPAKPAAEAHQGAPVKPGRVEEPPAPRPAAKDTPPSPEPSREVRPQTGRRPSPEVKAPPQPRSLPDSPRQAAPLPAPPAPGKDVTKPAERIEEVRPQPSQPAPGKDVTKPVERIEEDKPQPSPPAPGPSATSLPSATVQRQPERHSASREAGETDASRQPLAQPLAPRRPPSSPQTMEGAAPEKPEPPAPSVEQPRPVEIRPASPFRPSSSEPEPGPSIPPVTAKPAALPIEKPFTMPELEKPLVFRPVLARMRSRPGPQAQLRLQTGPTKVARAAAIRTRTFPERITARGTVNLVHRQMRPAAQTLPAREPVPDQPLAASPAQQPPDLPVAQVQPRGKKPRPAPLPPVFARPPLRLSLRSLTAPRRISGQTAARVRPSTARPVQKESRPLLLTQHGPAANTNTRLGSKPHLSSARPVEPAAGKPDLVAGSAPSSVPLSMPSFAPSSAPAFLPSFLPSGDPHPWGEKMLVTRSGRQWIQRQLQQGASSGVVSSRPDERQQPPTASSHESMVARHTITPARRVDPAASSRKADPKEKKPAGKMSPKAASSARPVGTEPVRSPVEDLPVVQPKKMAPVEQVIQRQMEVPGPVVQRAIVETPQIESAPAYVDPEGSLDLAKLARDVYPIIKRMIAVEKERTSGRLY